MDDLPRDAGEITRQLLAVRDGRRDARDALFESVYASLRRLAAARLRGRPAAATLDATDLVHEAYLRLVDQTRVEWRDRGHFFAVAARAMRQIAIDRARRRVAAKRGGGAAVLELQAGAAGAARAALGPEQLIALEDALERLGALSPRLVQVVELCFFAGLTTDEAADALGVSSRTVKRDWQKARALLFALIGGDTRGSAD